MTWEWEGPDGLLGALGRVGRLAQGVLGASARELAGGEGMQESYPKDLKLRDGATVRLRMLAKTREDAAKLLAFFQSVPEGDRMFLKEEADQKEVVEGWIANLNYTHVLPLIAEAGGRVVGHAALIRPQARWCQHVGEIRVIVIPQYRAKGLGTALAREAFLLALQAGLEKIVADMTPDQKAAIALFEKLGFKGEGLLTNYFRDREGRKRDLMVMAYDVKDFQETMQTYGLVEAPQPLPARPS